jgi:hypothetical protein
MFIFQELHGYYSESYDLDLLEALEGDRMSYSADLLRLLFYSIGWYVLFVIYKKIK